MSPDEVCESYSTRKIRLSIREVDDFVLIEGDRASLEFLSDRIGAQAGFEKDCGFEIAPSGPGGMFFHPNSEKGVYIHRIDSCEPGR
jgi:hypothetical protein